MRLPSSFRDPSGNIFARDGVIFRQVNIAYQEQYDFFMDSGLYDALVNSGLLIRHEEVTLDRIQSPNAYKILQPEPIPFISYPYEWCFSQLKDAALITLDIQKKALEFRMTLKDASAFNMQFFKGKPILIDTLSFQKYQEGEPWVAYRQFCQHFLAPLALMTYQHIGTGQLSQIYIDGIPLDMASTMLPMRTHLKPSIEIHIHLHARLQTRYAGKPSTNTRLKGRFNLRSFQGLIDSLETAVKKLRWHPPRKEWLEYYDHDSYSAEALNDKIDVVTSFLQQVKPKTVWDLGANTGLFSRLASDMGIETISFDRDPAVVDRNYLTAVNGKETKVLPLLLDLTNPSPRIGWANRERMNLFDRGPVDMLFALALIHHLAIAGNVPLNMIAEFFSQVCTWAIVEFIPKSDKNAEQLLAFREDVFPTYTQEHFEKEFGSFFQLEVKRTLRNSERTLYLLRKR